MLNGRINRKTFILGLALATAVLVAICTLVVLPLALLDLVINNKIIDSILSVLYYIVAFPGFLYLIFISIMMVRRAHDFNMPGLLMVLLFIGSIGLGFVTDIHYFNIGATLTIVALCLVPGSKTRNRFGPAPRSRFSVKGLKVNT